MKRYWIVPGYLTTCALVAPTHANITDQQLQQMMDQSALTFTGTIVEFNNSNVISPIEPGAVPMIVKVDHIDWAGGSGKTTFAALPGKEITVVVDPIKMPNANAMDKSVSTVFFANPVVYEKHIAVAAENALEITAVADLSKRIANIAKERSNAALEAAVKTADAIVTGYVKETRELSTDKLNRLQLLDNGRELYSEHAPGWQEALLEVASVEQGNPGKQFVLVVFPGTNDRMWARAPKFHRGQVGIWMLHKGQLTAQDAAILLDDEQFHDQRIQTYTALTIPDFQLRGPGDQNLKEIRRLIKATHP
jgi:uncharacterized small protein (DUF1192 family)